MASVSFKREGGKTTSPEQGKGEEGERPRALSEYERAFEQDGSELKS